MIIDSLDILTPFSFFYLFLVASSSAKTPTPPPSSSYVSDILFNLQKFIINLTF